MKTKPKILIPILCSLLQIAIGQTDSSDFKANKFFLYKTEADFFNKKAIYRGQFEGFDGRIIKYSIPGSKEKRSLNLKDSCSFYFAYEYNYKKKLHIYPADYSYSLFGGGNKDAFCTLWGTSANYDKDGFATELFYENYFEIDFSDRKNNIRTTKIEEFLKSKPKLLEKYLVEKAESDKKAFKRQKLAIGIKYLKLFIAEK